MAHYLYNLHSLPSVFVVVVVFAYCCSIMSRAVNHRPLLIWTVFLLLILLHFFSVSLSLVVFNLCLYCTTINLSYWFGLFLLSVWIKSVIELNLIELNSQLNFFVYIFELLLLSLLLLLKKSSSYCLRSNNKLFLSFTRPKFYKHWVTDSFHRDETMEWTAIRHSTFSTHWNF